MMQLRHGEVAESMAIRTWLLLSAAILVATLTATVMASFGPTWPGVAAPCGAREGIFAGDSAERIAAIGRWHSWWTTVYTSGLIACVALIVAWVWNLGISELSAVRWTVVVVAFAAVLLAVGDGGESAIQPFALAWNLALDFPSGVKLRAPALVVVTLLLVVLCAKRAGSNDQAIAQLALVALLASAWIGLLATAQPDSGQLC